MEETLLLCSPHSWCNPIWHMVIVILFIGLPPAPFIYLIMRGPTPEEKERERLALAAACYHCRHTRQPCSHHATEEEDPLC